MWRQSACLVYVLLWTIREAQCQSEFDPVSANQSCSALLSCRKCIQSSLGCRWCSDVLHKGPRCSDRDLLVSCTSGLEDPDPRINTSQDKPFSNEHQIRPQKIDLHLPIGKPVSFKMKVKPAAVFPLDVYFLMDLSLSMEDDLRSLQQLANSTIKAIRDITPDSTIGFGSFVDKPTEPYIVSSLCSSCVPAYSYSHSLSLTKDVHQFLEVIGTRNISTSRDNPEGSFDALYQTVVCNEIIGWRPTPTRKIVVLLTDHLPHIGGDGKISGSIRPHPRACQLSKTLHNSYNYDQHQAVAHDYPSLSMLYSKLLENNIFVIFGIPLSGQDAPLVVDLYSTLQKEFPSRMSFARLQADSQDINRRLEHVYNEISSKVQLSFSSPPEINITYQCTPFIDGQCPFLERSEIEIDVTVHLEECTPKVENGVDIVISTNLFGEVVVHVTAVCDCQCTEKPIQNNAVCNGNGELVCGICQCFENWLGEECECDGRGLEGTLSCPRGMNGEECSGVGQCYCGRCNCQQNVNGISGYNYYGNACECNNFTCGLDTNSMICSGHGMCECGECVCDKAPSGRPYTGEICDCYPDDDVCQRTPEEGPCGNHGDCMCGECKCNHGFAGQFCQFCIIGSVCGPKGCKSYEPCVSCLYSIEGNSVVRNTEKNCLEECQNVTLLQRNQSFSFSETLVECLSGDQCSGIKYFVHFESKLVFVEDVPTRCPISPVRVEPWIIAIPLLVGLIILALILLAIIKMILKYLDYREYKQFERDASKIKFPKNENPMYKPAWQTFECPVYSAHSTNEDKSRLSESSTLSNIKTQVDGIRTPVRIGGSTIHMSDDAYISAVSNADGNLTADVFTPMDQPGLDEPDYESIEDMPIGDSPQ